MSVVESSMAVTNRVGLHARPAALFVQSAAYFQSHIQVCCGERQTNAKSIVSILKPGPCQGTHWPSGPKATMPRQRFRRW